jgi:hypothetical protein
MRTIEDMIENTTLTLSMIAKELGVTLKQVGKVWRKYPAEFRKRRKHITYSRAQKIHTWMIGRTGADHPNYKGVVGDNKGYLMMLKPDWYTGRRGSKHVFLHNIVVCERLKITEIPRGWCVHHVDFDPHNNEFDNLVLMTTSDHGKLHQWMKRHATTISKESTLKWVEAHGTPFQKEGAVKI